MLVTYDPSLLNKSSKTHKYPIHLAVMANNVTVLHAMLDNGAKPDLIDQDGHTLIHYATGTIFQNDRENIIIQISWL